VATANLTIYVWDTQQDAHSEDKCTNPLFLQIVSSFTTVQMHRFAQVKVHSFQHRHELWQSFEIDFMIKAGLYSYDFPGRNKQQT
jgi:hypothetical protein